MADMINANSLLNRLLTPANRANEKETDANSAVDKSLNKAIAHQYADNNPVQRKAPQDSSSISAAMIRQSEEAYGYSNTMSLQLTTKEGDKVTVDFRQLYAQYQSYKEAQAGQQDPTGVRYFESRETMEMTAFEERFAFSVEGDLNEDELGAIFDVFAQVDKLANQFYEGNIENALQEAMKMELDFGQLQGMSLNLTQTQVYMSRQQQAAVAEYGETGKGQHADKATVAELPDYLQKWQSAIESLDQWFEDAQGAWNELMSGVASQRFADQDSPQGWFERVQSFHSQLLEMAQQRSDLEAQPTESQEVEPENIETVTSEKV